MKNWFIALVCSLAVVANADDPNRNPQDEELPIIVTITLPTVPKYCTGSLIKDLKILVKTQCFFNNGVIYNKDLRIRFPNDKTLYKPNSTDYDGDVGIITLNENENPPKCKSPVKLRKSDNFDGKIQIRILRSHGNQEVTEMKNLTLNSGESCLISMDSVGYDSINTSCVEKINSWEVDEMGDRGAPLFFDGLLAGIFSDMESLGETMVFEKLFIHLKFLEKHLENSAGGEKPTKKADKEKPGAKEINKEKTSKNETNTKKTDTKKPDSEKVNAEKTDNEKQTQKKTEPKKVDAEKTNQK